MMSFLSMARPLTRPKSSYSAMNLPSLVRIWMRWLWRSARISPHAGFSNSHQDLAVGAEFDHDASLVLFAGKFLEVIGARGSCIGHPDISVAVDMDTMRPHEHPAAEASDLLAGLVKMMDRI